MNYYKIKYESGKIIIDKAERSIDIIKKYDLATKENIQTRVFQLEGEQLAIAISNDTKCKDNVHVWNFNDVVKDWNNKGGYACILCGKIK